MTTHTCEYCEKPIKPTDQPVAIDGHVFHRYCAIEMGADVEQDFEPKTKVKNARI